MADATGDATADIRKPQDFLQEILDLLPKLGAEARRFARGDMDPDELLNEAVIVIADGGRKSWNVKTLPTLRDYVCSVMASIVSHRRLAKARQLRREAPKEIDEVPLSRSKPDRILEAGGDEITYEELWRRVRARLEKSKNPLALKVYDDADGTVVKPKLLAARYGVPVSEIKKAREIIAYAIRAEAQALEGAAA